MLDEYEERVEWLLACETRNETSEKFLLQCHIVHQQIHMKSTGTEPYALRVSILANRQQEVSNLCDEWYRAVVE
jgi:hypothetical protein